MPDEPQLPMFYKSVVALSRERHKGWFVDGDQGFSFASGSNSIYVAATEFAAVAREYPVVFARDANGRLVPAALLGLERDQNLMVDAKGRWLGRYVPAYLRRYPFILATPEAGSDQFTVCIDESYSGFNTAQEGQQLVKDDGEQGELLSTTVKFLQEFHQHTLMTSQFCENVDELGLVDPMQAKVTLNSGESYALSGFFAVTREKLKALDADQVKSLMDKDYLDLVYLHMHSLANIDRLMELEQQRLAASPQQGAA